MPTRFLAAFLPNRDDLSAEELRRVLHYEPLTGAWTWLRSWKLGKRATSREAGYVALNGYVSIRLNGKRYAGHRLAWLYMTGKWPKTPLDHINAISSDNRWENLREADGSQNQANKRLSRQNTSGFKGVSWREDGAKWVAQIRVRGRCIYLGRFNTPEQAHAAYVAAAIEHWGAFARAA